MANVVVIFSSKDEDVIGMEKHGILRDLVEIDVDGWPLRELALGENDKVIHRYDKNDPGSYSAYIGPILDENGRQPKSEMPLDEFEEIWKKTSSSDPSHGSVSLASIVRAKFKK